MRGAGGGGAGGRDWLGVGYDPAGERVSLGWGAEGSQEGGRTFRTGPPLGAVGSGGVGGQP